MRLKWWEILFTRRAAEGSFAKNATGIERLTPLVFLASLVCLGLGVYLPIVQVSDFLVFTDTVAIYQGIWRLFEDGEYLLGLIVLAFSIVLPMAKVIVADIVSRSRHAEDARTQTWIDLLNWIGRWSMLDVLVVALVIFSLKASMFGDARSEPGLYLFAASIVFSSLGVAIIKRSVKTEK